MVFGRFHVCPPPGLNVEIRSDSKVSPMNMGMRSVSVHDVAGTKTRGNLRAMVRKAVNRNDARNYLDSG
jgi:hypothetical protein